MGDSPSMIDLFHMELDSHSLVLEQGLANADETLVGKRLETLMRAAHSLKGAARIVGLDGAARLSGAMEELLNAAQAGSRRLGAAELNHLGAAIRFLRGLAASKPSEIEGALARDAGNIAELIQLLKSPGCEAAESVPQERAAATADSALIDLPLLDLFRTEVETHSRVLEEGLVEAESNPEPAKLQRLMRAAHSLKGAARILALDSAVQLAHAMEDMFSAAQRGQRQLTSTDFDLLLNGTDVFMRLAGHEPAEIPAALARDSGKVEELLKQLSSPSGEQSSFSSPMAAASATPKTHVGEAAEIQVEPPAKTGTEKREAASVRVSVENLSRLTGFAGECMVEVKTFHSLIQSAHRIKQRHSGISLSIERALEALTKESAVEAQSRLEEALREAGGIHATVSSYLNDLERFSHKLDQLSNSMYDEAVASRMRPFSDGVHGFSRMIRDVAKSLGKKVAFEIEGESTPVDRDILEKLEAPLTHLLRNALDHGIEMPDSRMLAHKAPEGKLTLSARHVAGILEIAVADDGGGIDVERIRRSIVNKGHATPEMAQKLNEGEVLEFLFLPGFSTSQKVTEISGRGVGLDIVQSMARQVGGNTRISSKLHEGTRIVMQLPLTLSVLRTLLFEINGQNFALPLMRIDRVLRIRPEDVLSVQERQYIRVGDQNVGLIEGSQVLGFGDPDRSTGDLCAVILSDNLNRYGLVVDRFVGEHDLVVIPLPPRLGKVPDISAGAILEDGSPVGILDSEDLVRSIDNILTHGLLIRLGRKSSGKASRKRVLVADDSLTVREVERRLLENRGYEVIVAVDGMDAWNAVQSSDFDLVVTDVDMPRMDGIELVKRIKSSASTASMPVMIVSYKDQDEYRTRGLEAGASYYLTKSSFHDEKLIDAVRDLIGEAV